MAANDAVSMSVAENRQNVPMAIQENRAAVQMTVAEGGVTPGRLNRKADKVTGAVAGNLAGLDANGNLTDSGKAPGDFLEAPATAGSDGQVLTADGEGGASWQDPTGGDPTEIIDDNAGSGDTDKVWSADKSHELLTQINSRPESVGTDASGVDLDVVDEDGYVLARFKNGHFQTKNFNSKDVEKASATVFTDAEHSGLDVIDENGNVVLRLMNGDIQTRNFNSKEALNPVEYKFSGDDLLIGYGYNSTYDAVIVMNEGRANNLFDFSDFKLKTKGTPLSGLETADLVSVWHSGTDMHGPFEFLAVNNADGVKAESTDPGWTGGIHTIENSGEQLQTASTKYLHVFADGVPVSSGYGRCNNLEIRWANNVQAYNCVKADGTGRTSMIEYHDMVFDGIRFNEKVKISPTEDIKMQLWYGFQGVAFGSVYENVEFIDATNRQTFTTIDSNTVSGNSVTSGIRGFGDDHAVEILVDITTDLGKRDYYSGTEGAFAIESTGKTYFNIIRKFGSSQVVMNENTNYYLNGSYRFYPVVQ